MLIHPGANGAGRRRRQRQLVAWRLDDDRIVFQRDRQRSASEGAGVKRVCMKELPESFSAEEIIDKIILLQKIDIGLEQSKNGKVFSEIDARKKLKKN